MNRRSFLKNSSLAGFSIPFVAASVTDLQQAQSLSAQKEKRFNDIDLMEITIDELQQKMQGGGLTSKQIAQWYLNRIEEVDKKGPKLNSIIELNPDATAIAENMDDERRNNKVRGPLHGIPVLIKDNIDTADKMMTTAGSLALEGNIASKDAFIVKQLREAGAVILGKTNLSEFANFRSTHSASGWSSRGGQTKCPYILNRNPSGSSSGSGCAVAANLCVVAVGTETDGSVVSPASINCLVGIKPTVGLLSRSGIIPISATQDSAGPMTRTVKDAAILLGVLAGADENDAATKQSLKKAEKDYTKFLNEDGLKGKRLGIEKSFFKGNPDVVALLNKTIELLKQKGAVIVEVELLKSTNELNASEFTVLQYEFKDGLNKYLAAANSKVKSLKEVIAFNKENETDVMPFFKQEILISSEEKKGLDSKEYKDALAKSLSARKIIDDTMHQHSLDAICGTTSGLSWCIDIINGDYDTGFSFSSPAAMAGYPHITVPMGFVHELPMGFSFIASAYSEPELFEMAYAFEQATKMRKAPKFINDVI